MLKKISVYLFLMMSTLFAQEKTDSATKSIYASAMKQQPNLPCPDHWRLSGDFLYFVPTLDDTYFVIQNKSSSPYPTLERKNNDFSYNPGFRVGAEFACCDKMREFQAFFSLLNTTEKRLVAGENLWATTGMPDVCNNFENYTGSAASHINVLYQHLDVNFSQQVGNSYGLYYYFQPGLEYAYLRMKEGVTYFNSITPSTGIIDQRSKLWGVGPQLGFVLDYNFINEPLTCKSRQGFSILAQCSGSILVGRGKTENFQSLQSGITPVTTFLNVEDEHAFRTFPALHAHAGLSYFIRGERAGCLIEVGYEFNSYIRGLARSIFVDDVADSLCITNYYNFDIQGLYVSGRISF